MTFEEWYQQGSKITKLGFEEMGDFDKPDLKIAWNAAISEAIDLVDSKNTGSNSSLILNLRGALKEKLVEERQCLEKKQ